VLHPLPARLIIFTFVIGSVHACSAFHTHPHAVFHIHTLPPLKIRTRPAKGPTSRTSYIRANMMVMMIGTAGQLRSDAYATLVMIQMCQRV
jgi:hypothetical protein